MHDLGVILNIIYDYNEEKKIHNIVVGFKIKWYQSEKKLLLRQTGRIHYFTVLNGYKQNS